MTPPFRSLFTGIRHSIYSTGLSKRYPRLITLARHLSSPSRNQPSSNSKPDREHLDKLVWSIEGFLRGAPKNDTVDAFVHRRLDQFCPLASEPHVAYGKIISSLIRHRYFKEASGVYERMIKDDLLPSSKTKTEMLAIALVLCDSDPELIKTLDIIAKDPTYTEDHFLHLLQIMGNVGASYEHLLRVVEQFVEARGEGYSPSKSMVTRLVDAQTRAGLLEDAFESILRYDDESSSSPTDPYVTIIQALTETKLTNAKSFNKALKAMQANNVKPDIAVLNALISRELRLRSLHKAFAIYHVIIQLSTISSLSPDPSTFGILFSVLAKLYRPDLRSARSRPFKRPDNVVPPRQMYRDLLFFRERCSFDITPSLLNGALRAFIQTQDYAGAFVVLRSFSIFRLPVTAKTYFIIMRHLVHRIRWDLKGGRKNSDIRWGDRFVGTVMNTNPPTFKKFTIDEYFAEKVLAAVSRPTFHLANSLFEDEELSKPVEKASYNTPTLAMIDGEVPVPESWTLHVLPLQRILRRAIFAAVEGESGDQELPPSKRVSDVIVDAKREMFPGKEHPYEKVDFNFGDE